MKTHRRTRSQAYVKTLERGQLKDNVKELSPNPQKEPTICLSSSKVFNDPSILSIVLMYLNPHSCLWLSEVNKALKDICQDDQVWKFYCHEYLWKNKIHVPHAHITKGFRSAYYRSIVLARYAVLSKDDICHWIFSFRFKSDAGDHWISNCPWHMNKDATVVRFWSDMQVARYAHKDVSIFLSSNQFPEMLLNEMGFNASWRKNMPSAFEDVLELDPHTNIALYNHGHTLLDCNHLIPDPFFPYTKTWSLEWKYKSQQRIKLKSLQGKLHQLSRVGNIGDIKAPELAFSKFERHLLNLTDINDHLTGRPCLKEGLSLCLNCGIYGNSIKVLVQDVPVPSYLVFRSPTDNWGYVLQSCWAVYTSWKMPLRGECQALEDEELQVTVDQQLHEINLYNSTMVGLEVPID